MGAQVLPRCSSLGRLRALNLTHNQIGSGGIKDLAAFRNLTALRELNLSGNEIDDEAARALLTSPLCRQLDTLDLSSTDISPATLPAIRALKESSRLRKL